MAVINIDFSASAVGVALPSDTASSYTSSERSASGVLTLEAAAAATDFAPVFLGRPF